MRKKRVLFILLILLSCQILWAKDFGVILDQSLRFGGQEKDPKFDYEGILIPRFSALLGDNSELLISMGINASYLEETWIIVPELLRTEMALRFGKGELKFGRMYYTDPLGFIAEGLFDGAGFSLSTAAGTFSIGTWYTGLLYKNRAEITMTQAELESLDVKPDYSNFANTYFAPKRLLSALEWEHPSLGNLFKVKASILGQFDISGADLHSQYAALRISLPVDKFVFSLGGCLELIEDSDDFGIGLAGEAGIAWMLPTPIEDCLSLMGRFSSGVNGDNSVRAFLPVTTTAQGELLEAKFSGISMLSLNYLGRFHRNFSASLSSSYFIRTDKETYQNYGTKGKFLGNEFFGQLIWSPVSDLQFNLSGGVFLPSMGNADPDADKLWRIGLNIILSLY